MASPFEDFKQRQASSPYEDFRARVQPAMPNMVNNDNDSIGTAMYHGLLGAAGNLIHTANDAMVRAGKPKQYTDEEWFEKQTPLSKAISQFGRDLEEEHKRNYTPWSANRVASGIAGVAPYAVGLGLTGAAMARTGNYKALADSAYQIASKIGFNPKAAEIASKAVPAITYGTAMKAPESLLEGQGAYDDFIEESKRNGTYVKGKTEQQASELADKVTRDNLALLMGSGSLEEYLLASRPGGSVAKSAIKKILGGSAINAGEEAAQQILPKAESGKDWHFNDEDVLESALIGAIAGGGMQAAGVGMNAFPLRNESLEQAQAIINQQNQEAQGRIFDEAGMQKILNQVFNDTYNQSDQFAESQPAPTISAENSLDGFDNRYVSKWESKPGATDLAGVQQSVKNAFNAAIAEYGDTVTLTGGAEKGYHAEGAEGHEGGWKIDVDKASVKDPQKFLQAMAKYGFQVGDEGDHYDLSGHAKGGVGGTVVATPDSFVSDGGQAASDTDADMSRFNSKQREAWNEAQWVEQQTGIPAEYIYRQWAHESGNFTSRLATENNNFGGLTQSTPNGEENKQPDGGNYYRMYNNMHEYAESYVKDFINRYDGKENVKSMEDFVNFLHSNGYFTADPSEYLASMQGVDAPTSRTGYKSSNTDIDIPNTKVDTSEEDRAFDEYNKQLDELAEKGIEAPFKTEQPTQKELVQQAKEAAIDAGDMDEVQRINSAERSGNTEELAKIAETARKAKEKEVKGKAAPATPEIKMASPNLVAKVRELLNTAKEQGVPLRDTLVQNTLNDGSEETMQNFAGMLQSMINAHGYEQRKDQGKQLLDYADENQVDFKPGLRKMLREGQPKAIDEAQRIINEARNTPQVQPANNTVQSENTQTPVQVESAQNEQLTMQDRVNQVRGNEPGTPVNGVKVSELASIINNAGSQQQAPSKETKQAEPAPSAETAPADENYHGFFDDKKPGAVREAKKRLEEKINPFGDAEGFRTVKSIVERWAETDESNQSSTKGRSYYVHGNKVSKAAYDYYNHLRKNADEEVKEKSAPKQETTAAKEEKYPELTKSNRDQWENIAKNASPAMMKMYGESAVENAEKEGVKIDENLAKDAKEGNPEAIAYIHQLVEKHSYENFDKLPKAEPKSTEIDPVKAHDNLKQLYKDITGKKQLGSNWASTALRKAVELGYTLSEDEKAIVSPEGKRYELSGKAIEEFRLNLRNAEDSKRENVDNPGDKSAKTKKDSDNELSQQDNGGKIEVETAGKEVVENEQQGESGSPAGGHSGVRAGESEGNQRGVVGEVSERNGQEGEDVHRGGGEEDASGLGVSGGVRTGTELDSTAGKGTGKRGNQPTVPLTEAEAHPSPTEIPGHDYEIKDTDESTKSEKVRFKQNVDAIKLLKQLEADDRMPTPAEQEILAGYNGWGGLKGAFLPDSEMNKEIKELLTDDEYKAAKSTINDAFYTPPKIIRAIWEGVSHLGFKGGRVLDPSMGVGNFFGTMPRDMLKKSALRGVEIDDLTSRFGKMLYPNAFVEHKGFERANVADNYFDLAISNIPFGQNMIDGYQVHNYFFANGIDKVRPGGLMVYITSQGSLAGGKDAAKMRNYLSGQADLIAAYKLPSGVFSDAGTQVATDIVIFRKHDKAGQKSSYGHKFGDIKEVKTGSWYSAPSYGINEYFDKHPDNILGEKSHGRDQWGNPALNVKMPEGTTVADVANKLQKAMEKLPVVYEPVSRKKAKTFDNTAANKQVVADEKTRDYEYYYSDGKVVQNQDGKAVEVTGTKAKVVNDYLKVKNTLNALLVAQRDPNATEKAVEGLRKQLNKDYDSFVAKHGELTGKAAASFRDDPSAGMVQALEKPIEEEYTLKNGQKRKRVKGAEKADIFTVRTTQAQREVTHVEKADDALIASLTNQGTVDLDYMAKLMDSTPDKVVAKLHGKIFKNPATEDYETREEYLSGNVREKLAQAKEAARTDKSYTDNVKELEKVIPEDLVSDEIIVNLGSPWIPVQDVQDFATHLSDNITVKFSRGAALWTVSGWGSNPNYKLQGISLPDLLEHVLNNKAIQIFDGSGKEKVLNQEKTDAANVAADELQQEFKDWIWQDKEREKRLVRYYNDNYNNTVIREYDGSHLTFPGMNAKIAMKDHQKNVVWRMLQGGNTLIAHCVGAGKTFEMQAAGMEMRRLGIANKPMYCLPNNVVEQFAREFRQLYPGAKLLVLQSNDLPAVERTTKIEKTEDGRTKKIDLLKGKTPEQRKAIMEKRTARNRMLARIRTEDWDGIIISHNLFQRFPVTPETAADFIQQEIDRLEDTILEAKGDRNLDKRTLSNMETSKKNLESRLEEVISTDVDDIGIPFEELGIDQLFVDEADMFKNLEFATRLGQIRGLTNSNAARSRDMFLKTQWLTNNQGGRGVVFATGTPVSNTMSELYTMMRYLDMQGLKEKGLELFDNWMRTFGDIGQGIERKPTGDGFRKVTMVKKFINMADLTKMFRKFADVKTQDDLTLNIPKLKNDKATVVTIDADPAVVDYIKNKVPERVAKMKGSFKKQKGEDNMLALTNDLRKLSLTDSKIEACADTIAKKYHDTTDVKGAQLVFCDMGIPKAETDKDSDTDKVSSIESPEVYRELIAKLKEKGIPEKDIAFIQNYNTKQKRDDVFQKVNNGDIRILIGSTETMGAGTNCQTHLVALHDLDAPWRPRDLEQRHGRILRQGNQNKEVEIFNYVVKDSFDANMWEKLKNKAAIIAQAMSGDMSVRTVDDADLVTLSYAEIEGAATGNPLIKEQLQVNNELTKYQHAQTAFKKKIRNAENTLAGSEETIAEAERIIDKIKKDIANRKDTKGENFSMTIGGKNYKDRGEAQQALDKVLKNLTKTQSVEIGQIGGLRLTGMYKKDAGEVFLQLIGNRAYGVKTNSVAGIENTLRNGPDNSLAIRSKELDDYKNEVEQARKIAEQENPYAKKVKELSDRLNQLNREIEATLVDDGSKGTSQAADTSVDSEPEQNVKQAVEEGDGLFYINGNYVSLKESFPKGTDEAYRMKFADLAKKYQARNVFGFEYDDGKTKPSVSFDRKGDRDKFLRDARKLLEEKPQVKEESKPELAAESPVVQEYKDKVDKILEGAKKTGITSRYVTRIQQLIGDIEQRRLYYKDLSNEDAAAAKEYANNALAELKQEPVSDHILVGTVPPAGKSTANVNVDEFEHTKTGKMIPAASLKDHVAKEFRKQATAIAKNHGGKWSPFAKRILFKTEQGRDDFVREVEALLSANEGKASTEGEIAKAVRNAKVVDNADLTPQQRKMSEFGKQMGTPIMWISTNPNLHGFHAPNGTTVLNVRSNMDLSKTFWHEAFHWVAGNNEGLYNELLDYFKGKSAFSKKQLDAYRKRIGRPGISDELAMEEMLADYFEEVKDRVKIFKEMGAEQPSLARKFVAWVKRIMDKFAEFFHNPEGKLTTAQRDSFVKAFGRLARDMKDGEGRPLFKVYKEGKEIRLTNGRLVTEGIKLSAENDIDKHLRTGHNRLKKRHVGWVTNRVEFVDGYPKVDLLFEFDAKENSNTTMERRKQELYFIDGRMGDDYKTALINILGERKEEVDHRVGISSANEAVDVYRTRFNEIIALSVGNSAEEESNIVTALALIQGGIEYAKTTPGYNAERDVRFSFGQRENEVHAGGNQGRSRGLQSNNGRYGLERADNQGKVTTKHSEKGAFSNGETKYSYSASDNSNEGLFHKIKNSMSGKASEDSEKFRYRKHLTEMIEKALDVKLRYGKMDGKKDVVYKPENRVLRSRHAFDWENILPVAGRIAAEQLEIEPTESMNNYIADWILTGAPNNVSKEADTFHKAMREHPANSAKLEDLRDAFAEWLGKDYREQMQGTIQWKNKQKTTMQERKNKFYEEFVEELEPINRMVKQVNANLTEKGQKKLGIAADPMVAFRLLRGSYGRAMTALEGENDGAVEALKHAFPNVDFTGFKTLYQILDSIDAFQNAEKQRDFVTYCTACHIMDMHQHNDDIRQEQQHLKNKIEKLGTGKEDEKQKAEYEEQIEKLSDALMPIPATYSKDNCQKYIDDGYDKYHKAQSDLVHFSNTTAAILADSGVISEKRFQELLTKWQNYVPLFRVFEDNEDINFGDSMKHIKGSTRDIVNPLESIIRNTAQFIQKAELNKAKCLLADVARCDASGWLIEEVDKSDSDKTTITFLENGKRKYLQTDPDIVRAVNNMGVDSSHFFIKFLHAITRLARACFTMASPEFALRNVARDWQDSTLYTKYGMWVNPLDIVRGFWYAWKRKPIYYEWLTQGAAQASALSLDRDYTQSTLDKLGRSFWKRLTSRDFANALLEGLQMAGEYSEYGTRLAMYKKTKEAILKNKPNATKEEINAAMLEAAFESRDLMDFARHGKAGAEYNKITAFANASIQGWDKLYRSLDFKNDPKRAARTAAKLVLYGALPAMIIFAMYHDEDWYKDAPDWLKETHWLFKFGDTTIRIPKAADMGIRFVSNAVEKGLDETYNKRSHKAKDYFMPMWDALPGMLPTSILPIIEIQANHAFFTDRPIIPQGQDKLPAKLQYGPYTTSLAKWMGETFDIAPRNIEHFIAGYTGTLGMAIPKAIDLVSGQNQQSLSLEEMPLIRGYLYPQFKSPQSVNDFYKKLEEQTKLKNEYKLTHKRPEGFDPALLQRLENGQKQLRKISKQEKSIIDNPKWSISDKEVMQRNIQKKRIEIAKRALGTK